MTSNKLQTNNSIVKSIVIYPHLLDDNDVRLPENNLQKSAVLQSYFS